MFENLLTAPITLALLAANVIASLYALSNPKFMDENSFWIGPMVKRGEWYRAVSSAFLHVNTPHLLLNMFTLISFGPVLESVFGPLRYTLLYVGAMLGSSALMYFQKRNDDGYRAVGASGAISGLMLAVSILAPFQVLMLMAIIPIWAILFGVLFIALSIALSSRDNAIIAHGGHLGGALAGVLLTLVLLPGSGPAFVGQVLERLSGAPS
jgi:membrane associated rhomboid family serine protease